MTKQEKLKHDDIIIPGRLKAEFIMLKDFILNNTGLIACTDNEKELFKILSEVK